jgi:hypothetical protein
MDHVTLGHCLLIPKSRLLLILDVHCTFLGFDDLKISIDYSNIECPKYEKTRQNTDQFRN